MEVGWTRRVIEAEAEVELSKEQFLGAILRRDPCIDYIDYIDYIVRT